MVVTSTDEIRSVAVEGGPLHVHIRRPIDGSGDDLRRARRVETERAALLLSDMRTRVGPTVVYWMRVLAIAMAEPAVAVADPTTDTDPRRRRRPDRAARQCRIVATMIPNARLHADPDGHPEFVTDAATLAPVIGDLLNEQA
jgi:hypothetical protein